MERKRRKLPHRVWWNCAQHQGKCDWGHFFAKKRILKRKDIKPHVIFSHSKNSEARKTSSNTSEPLDRVDGKDAKTNDISTEQSLSLSNYSEGVGEHKIQVNQRKVTIKILISCNAFHAQNH